MFSIFISTFCAKKKQQPKTAISCTNMATNLVKQSVTSIPVWHTLLSFEYTHCFLKSLLSPLLPTSPVMKMHTKTDFVGAARELLGIVAAQTLTSILQVRASPTFLPLCPVPPLAQLNMEDLVKVHRRSAALDHLRSLPFYLSYD